MILGEINFVVIFAYRYNKTGIEAAVQCYASRRCVALRQILVRCLEDVWKSLAKDAFKCLPETFKILGWCPAGSVLPHGEKVPL